MHNDTSGMRELRLSIMRDRTCDRQTGAYRLAQGRISYTANPPNFAALANIIQGDLWSGDPDATKEDAPAWVPACFQADTLHPRYNEVGHWRLGAYEIDLICALVVDVDNDVEDQPKVRFEDIGDRLRGLLGGPISHFTHTSYSHTDDHPKFRVVLELSRPVTRDEAVRMYVWLNLLVFGGQGDASVYDPAHYLFGPPFRSIMTRRSGAALDVDSILGASALRPDLYEHYRRLTHARTAGNGCRKTEEEQQAHRDRMADRTVREGFLGCREPWFSPAWLEQFAAAPAGQHYTTFRSLLAKIEIASDYTLTRGEFEIICQELDAAAGGYMATKYADWQDKKAELLEVYLAGLDSRPAPVFPTYEAMVPPPPPDPLEGMEVVDGATAYRVAPTLPPTPHLLGHAYERGAVSILAGAGGSAKTNLTLVEALAMVTANDTMLSQRVREPNIRVLVLNFDEGRAEMMKRLALAAIGHGITGEEMGDRIMLLTPPASLFRMSYAEGKGHHLYEPGFELLTRLILKCRADVVMIDPLGPLLSGVNDNDIVYAAIERLRRVAEETNCAIQVVHHQNKLGLNSDSAASILGASALVNGPRLARVIVPLGKKELPLIDDSRLRGTIFRVMNAKANHAPPSARTIWLKREAVGLGNAQGWREEDKTGVPMLFDPPSLSSVDPAMFDKLVAEIARAWEAKQGYSPPGKKASEGRALADLARRVKLLNPDAVGEMVRHLIAEGRVVVETQVIAGSANKHPVGALRTPPPQV